MCPLPCRFCRSLHVELATFPWIFSADNMSEPLSACNSSLSHCTRSDVSVKRQLKRRQSITSECLSSCLAIPSQCACSPECISLRACTPAIAPALLSLLRLLRHAALGQPPRLLCSAMAFCSPCRYTHQKLVETNLEPLLHNQVC